MKNNGIIISGGQINSTNIVVGNNTEVNIDSNLSKVDAIENADNISIKWKENIAMGGLRETMEDMLIFFKEKDDKNRLNAVIINLSSLAQLEMQERLNTISHEQAKLDSSKITNSILKIIDC